MDRVRREMIREQTREQQRRINDLRRQRFERDMNRLEERRRRASMEAQRRRQERERMSRGMTAPARQPLGRISEQEMQRLMEEAMKQTAPGIRGMNSQTRIDMLKNPKFRK